MRLKAYLIEELQIEPTLSPHFWWARRSPQKEAIHMGVVPRFFFLLVNSKNIIFFHYFLLFNLKPGPTLTMVINKYMEIKLFLFLFHLFKYCYMTEFLQIQCVIWCDWKMCLQSEYKTSEYIDTFHPSITSNHPQNPKKPPSLPPSLPYQHPNNPPLPPIPHTQRVLYCWNVLMLYFLII